MGYYNIISHINNRKDIMKQNAITDSLFDHAKSLQDISTTANLYGRLLELQDQAINIQKRINEIQKEIDEVNNGKK